MWCPTVAFCRHVRHGVADSEARVAVQLNNSVARAFAILDLFTERRPELTAGEVARALNLNTVTAHRFLRSLAAVGAVVAVSRGTYRLGFLFADLGSRVVNGNCLAQAAQPVLDRVTAEINEASMAAIFENNMIACVAVALSGRTLSVNVRVGTRLQVYCSANGKLWLAYAPDHVRERYLRDETLAPLTARTVTDPAVLRDRLAEIRRQGYAINDGEREDGLTAVAVPVLGRGNNMLAGISVFGPTSRMTPEIVDRALARLRQAAKEIERSLYGRIAA